MVEYLPVGSQEAPQTIIAKKKISSPEILNYTPSPLCNPNLKGIKMAYRYLGLNVKECSIFPYSAAF